MEHLTEKFKEVAKLPSDSSRSLSVSVDKGSVIVGYDAGAEGIKLSLTNTIIIEEKEFQSGPMSGGPVLLETGKTTERTETHSFNFPRPKACPIDQRCVCYLAGLDDIYGSDSLNHEYTANKASCQIIYGLDEVKNIGSSYVNRCNKKNEYIVGGFVLDSDVIAEYTDCYPNHIALSLVKISTSIQNNNRIISIII